MRLKVSSVLSSCATLAAAALLAAPMPPAFAQASGPTSNNAPLLATPAIRVTAPIQNDALVMLKGNTSPMAQARYDQGAASTSLATGKMQLLLKRSPAQEIALREYMGSLQDPHAATYHKWLTPQTYGASFGVADQDLQAVESWLQSQGFKIESVPASRNLIQFSGTTGQVAQAFHTSIHAYLINGEKHYSNASDPQIPAALAPVITGISPLNDFHPRPMHVLGGHAQVQSKDGALSIIPGTAQNAAPALTGTTSTGGPFLFVTPSDAATIYNAPNALNRSYTGSDTGNEAAGVNIGLVGDSDLQTADYQNYRRLFLNDPVAATPTIVVDGEDPGFTGDAIEALVDTEFAAGLAPQANIFYYVSKTTELVQDGIYDAALRAVEDNTVAVLSISYGNCEAALGFAGNAQFSVLYQQAAAQGITVLVSSGDSGSAGCDPHNIAQASGGLAVSGLASTSYNVAVGGTDFDTLVNNFSQYVTAATAPTTTYLGSALSYIPENPWNDSIMDPPRTYTSNKAFQYPLDGGGTTTQVIGGGGGVSNYAICNGAQDNTGNCLVPPTGYVKPPFQSAIGGNVRSIPDVSLFASDGFHQATWAFCIDPIVDSTATVADCMPDSNNRFQLSGVGGTSTAAPAFAGILAQVIQSLPQVNGQAQRLGLANNILYNLANGSNSASIFHDITVGNNSEPCVAGSSTVPDPNCGSNGFLTGYNAGTGYDLATGLGSVNIAALVNGWDTAIFTPTSVSLLAAVGTGSASTAPISIVHGTPVTFSTTVTPTNATGTVAVIGPVNQAGAAVSYDIPLTGSGTGSVSDSELPGGSYNIHAYYQGDVSHSSSTSSPAIAVNITPEASTPAFALQIIDVNSHNPISSNPVPYGEDGFAYVQPTNSTGVTAHGIATGSATLLNNGSAFAAQALNAPSVQTLNSQGVAAFPLYGLVPGSYNLSATYSGDKSYNPSSTAASTLLTIVKGNTALFVTSTSSTIAASGTATITVELATDSIGHYPAGPITLSMGTQTFASSAAPVPGVTTAGGDAYYVTYTIPGATLASGNNTLTANYGGDNNYNAAAPVSLKVNVSGGSSTGAGFALAGPSSGINVSAPGASGTGTVSITPTNGFTGTVNLTCTVPFNAAGPSPSCSVPSSVAISANTAASATVTITTKAQSASLAPSSGEQVGTPSGRWLAAGGGMALCSVLLFTVPARRRAWRSMLIALFAIGILGIIGCGGTSTNNNSGTQPGSYTVTVTGSSGGITANTQIVVNVQ